MQQLAGAGPPEPPPALIPSAGARRGRHLAAIVLGALLLGLLVSYAGLGPIIDRLRTLGWSAPLILVPYLIVNVLDTFGWRRTLPPDVVKRVPFGAMYLARMAGEAVNSLTPTAAVGGEPVKAHLLRSWDVKAADGVASVVIAKTALTVAQITFILVALTALFDRLERRLAGAIWVTALILLALGFSILLVRMQRRGLVTTVWRWLHRIVPRARFVARLESKAQEIDARLADFYGMEGRAFRAATLWHFGGWILGVFEVQLIMFLIGAPIGFRDALIIEGLAQPIRAVALFIPGGLGAQEMGGVALCRFLGIPEAVAVTLWLLKRARELAFDAVGVTYLTRHTTSRRR